jgi:hypothetical protein
VVVRDSHQPYGELSAAAPWFRRAHAAATEREIKAEAAFLAAKVELMTELAKLPPYTYHEGTAMPVPKTWYPVMQGYSDTNYYGQVLAECGTFRSWVAKTQHQTGKPSKN